MGVVKKSNKMCGMVVQKNNNVWMKSGKFSIPPLQSPEDLNWNSPNIKLYMAENSHLTGFWGMIYHEKNLPAHACSTLHWIGKQSISKKK